jgi:GTPase SAR1 family protein
MQQFKIVLLGDSGVGKSTMMNRYITGNYEDHKTTIGIDFRRKTVLRDDKKIFLHIWDTINAPFRAFSLNHI